MTSELSKFKSLEIFQIFKILLLLKEKEDTNNGCFMVFSLIRQLIWIVMRGHTTVVEQSTKKHLAKNYLFREIYLAFVEEFHGQL